MDALTRRCILRQLVSQTAIRLVERELPAPVAKTGSILDLDANRFQVVDVELPDLSDFEEHVHLRIGA